jgi:hypothetical protein
MSGIRTIDDLKDRCRVDEESGCWLWGASTSEGYPRLWIGPKCMTGGRAAWLLSGREIGDKRSVYHVRRCSSICVNPEHLACGTKAEAGAVLRELGYLRGHAKRAIVNTKNGRTKSKFSPELRQWIMESQQPATVLGPQLGLAHQTVSLIRQGRRWRSGASGSSIFSLAA